VKNKSAISILLFLSLVLLGVLVPGGPIETRSFAHINPMILGAFNTFLTSLGMISMLLVYFVLEDRKWTLIVSAICGISYFSVYALDLGGIFPISPDAMPQSLLVIEVMGMVVSLPLMFLSILEASRVAGSKHVADSVTVPKNFTILIAVLVIAGISIIIFATRSAMGG